MQRCFDPAFIRIRICELQQLLGPPSCPTRIGNIELYRGQHQANAHYVVSICLFRLNLCIVAFDYLSQNMQELSLTDPNLLDQIQLPSGSRGVGTRPLGGGGPVTPYGSLTPSDVSLIAASEPPLGWDRDQDILSSPFSPRSSLSGRFTPTFGRRTPTETLSPSPGTSAKIKGIMNNFQDSSGNKEKARRLEQLRSGKFGKSKSGSKKWNPTTVGSSMKQKEEIGQSQGTVSSGIVAMKKSWESGGISPRQVEQPDKPANQQSGFGDVMKRFKQLEGSEKKEVDVKAEKAKKLSQMTAAFEQPKYGRGQSRSAQKSPRSAQKSPSINSASDQIRGKAAIFEQKK
eukprot:TRINITY_DN3507_c0_g1_i1.p1 TRINITY_DN3507_c0_g1~~TRINITY_DN3507_c0_g1_i1.p1  ORF type:complete len:344 (-),score=51.62 TRINITY_DN3507_c0_g1_i1:217-1248(-)